MENFMKKIFTTAALAIFCLALCTASWAEAFKSASIGGATGLITTPNANTGWEGNNMAIDFAYHYLSAGENSIPKVSLQLFGKAEVGAAYDMQKEKDSNDLLVHGKFRFYGSGSSALAIGGNYQMIKIYDSEYTAGQIYLAATHTGEFFGMPAETTIVIGKTFGNRNVVDKNNIDFSMGFDLDFLPNFFKGYVHWLTDFANYSYSVDPRGANSWRGVFNTGIRLAILRESRFKWNIDVLFTDVLDSNRDWAAGSSFGLSF